MTIEEIVNNGNLSVSEKLSNLDMLAIDYKNKIENTKKELIKDYRYCCQCEEYYKKKSWEEGIRLVAYQHCKNPLTGGYLDDYEYETATEPKKYLECPKGHRIIVDYDY